MRDNPERADRIVQVVKEEMGNTSKNSSENLSSHNKHKPTFTNTFVFKTKRELKCQNELFF